MNPRILKSLILMTIILMDLLAGMEFDLFVPSFPELHHHFSLTPFWVEAMLSVNFIGYCLSLFFVGWLADHYGRKPIILVGMVIFILGSIFCLWIDSYAFFLVGRFLQGVGIAAPAILSFLIIADLYSLRKQQFFSAMLNSVMNTAAAIAPVIGSYITLYFHWQGNFITLLILGIITLLMGTIFIPNTSTHRKEMPSLTSYLLVFKSKPLILLITNIIFLFIPYWIFVGMSPILYMKDLGVSLSHFGLYQGSLALIYAFGCLTMGLLMNNFKQKRLLDISNKINIISLICVVLVTYLNSNNPLYITLALITYVIAQVIPSNLLYPLSLNFIPHAKAKVAAIIQGARLIFSAICLQIAGFYYLGSFQSIGIIISIFILMVIITQFLVMNNRDLCSHMQD
jgi:DHA1 family bicyclomycin/chloramphenicol resistance-like MFS transporter